MPGAPKPCIAQVSHIARTRSGCGLVSHCSTSNSGAAGFINGMHALPGSAAPMLSTILIAVPTTFEPSRLGPLTLRNRIIKAATFEGMSYRGQVTEALVDFHRSVAAGGVGMTTVAYCAVSPEGRGAPNEMVLRPDLVPELKRLV